MSKVRELPADVRVIVDQLRRSHITSAQVHRLVSFIDEQYPNPKSQAELDAESLDKLATEWRGTTTETTLRAIAKRLREGKTT